jgi:hypothetical protein
LTATHLYPSNYLVEPCISRRELFCFRQQHRFNEYGFLLSFRHLNQLKCYASLRLLMKFQPIRDVAEPSDAAELPVGEEKPH